MSGPSDDGGTGPPRLFPPALEEVRVGSRVGRGLPTFRRVDPTQSTSSLDEGVLGPLPGMFGAFRGPVEGFVNTSTVEEGAFRGRGRLFDPSRGVWSRIPSTGVPDLVGAVYTDRGTGPVRGVVHGTSGPSRDFTDRTQKSWIVS